jgi:hypothetical protein
MIKINPTSFNLGQIQINQTVTSYVTIYNEGNDSVSVSNLAASCGCTVPSINLNPIASKASAIVSVSFTPNALGNSVKSVSFEIEGTKHTIYITANVI